MRLGRRIVTCVLDRASARLSNGAVGHSRSGRLPQSSSSPHSALNTGGFRTFARGTDVEVFSSLFSLHHNSRRRVLSAWRNLEEGFRLQSNAWLGSCRYSSVKKDGADDVKGPIDVDDSSPLDEDRFDYLADDVLHHLQDKIEVYGEDLNVDGFDLDYSSGVLTIRLGDLGTYVINKQTPNRQIWLSSPVSGPGRFDWLSSKSSWVYRRNNVELVSLLEEELSELLGSTIHLS